MIKKLNKNCVNKNSQPQKEVKYLLNVQEIRIYDSAEMFVIK